MDTLCCSSVSAGLRLLLLALARGLRLPDNVVAVLLLSDVVVSRPMGG